MKEVKLIQINCNYNDIRESAGFHYAGEGASTIAFFSPDESFVIKMPRFYKAGQYLDFLAESNDKPSIPDIDNLYNYAEDMENYSEGFGVAWGQLLAQLSYWNYLVKLCNNGDEDAQYRIKFLAPILGAYITADGVLLIKQAAVEHRGCWLENASYQKRYETLKNSSQNNCAMEGFYNNLRIIGYKMKCTNEERKSYDALHAINRFGKDLDIRDLQLSNIGFIGHECKIIDWGINYYFNINDFDTDICDYDEDEEDAYHEEYYA